MVCRSRSSFFEQTTPRGLWKATTRMARRERTLRPRRTVSSSVTRIAGVSQMEPLTLTSPSWILRSASRRDSSVQEAMYLLRRISSIFLAKKKRNHSGSAQKNSKSYNGELTFSLCFGKANWAGALFPLATLTQNFDTFETLHYGAFSTCGVGCFETVVLRHEKFESFGGGKLRALVSDSKEESWTILWAFLQEKLTAKG